MKSSQRENWNYLSCKVLNRPWLSISMCFWPLCCLFSFDIRNLTTPLVSSNSSHVDNIRSKRVFSLNCSAHYGEFVSQSFSHINWTLMWTPVKRIPIACAVQSTVLVAVYILHLLYSYNFNPIKNTHLRHVTVHYFSRIVQPEAVVDNIRSKRVFSLNCSAHYGEFVSQSFSHINWTGIKATSK
jgi:hypothetical protein